MSMNRIACTVLLAGTFLASTSVVSPAAAQSTNGEVSASAQLFITAKAKGSQAAPMLQQKDITVLLNKRPAQITDWTALRGQDAGLQLVFLFDESARSYLSLEIPSLRKFINALPPSAEVAVAYM